MQGYHDGEKHSPTIHLTIGHVIVMPVKDVPSFTYEQRCASERLGVTGGPDVLGVEIRCAELRTLRTPET